jgi:hypothetical protein
MIRFDVVRALISGLQEGLAVPCPEGLESITNMSETSAKISLAALELVLELANKITENRDHELDRQSIAEFFTEHGFD